MKDRPSSESRPPRSGPRVDRWVPEPLRSDPESLRRARLLILLSLTGFIWGPVFAPIHFFVGHTPTASLALVLAGAGTALVPLLLWWTGSLQVASSALCGILLIIVAEVTVVRGGFPVSALIWTAVIPLLALLLVGRRAALAWGAIVMGLLASLGAFSVFGPGLAVRMNDQQMLIIDVAGVLAFLMLVATMIWLYDAERQRSQEALEAANRAKSEFLARMSHEVRTPMNGVLGTVDLLAASELSGPQGEHVALIRKSARELLRIVTEVLDFATLEKGAVELRSESFDPRDELRGVTELFSVHAREKRIELASEVVEPLPVWLVGDAGRLRQVVVNLVSNAIKFTDRGEVRILVSGRRGHEGFHLRYDVHDTGCGIAAEDMERIYEPFSRVDESLSRRTEGGGLGLSISSELIALMGGRLWAESEPGVGSVFSFTVPVEIAPHPKEVAPARNGTPALARVTADQRRRRARRHVLLAEDNPINTQVTVAMLQGLGYRTDVASNGREAVEMARSRPYDVVLMDCQMPEMDGYEATQRLRAEPRLRRMPIIALTAHALKADRDECLTAGMDDYVAKPVDSADLEAVLGRWVR